MSFRQHVSRVHVVDADTFSVHDVIRVPHVQLASGQPSAQRTVEQSRYNTSYRHVPLPSYGPLSTTPITAQAVVESSSAADQRPQRFIGPRSEDALLPPPRNTAQTSRRLLDNEAPLSRSPESFDVDDRMSAQQRRRMDLLRERRDLVRAADANAPASVLVRQMSRLSQRFLDEMLPNISPAQEESLRMRARAVMRPFAGADESGLETRASEDMERDTALDRLPGRSSPETSNLSSRSILHALMMRSMRVPSEASTSAPSVSTAASVRANDGSESSMLARPARNWRQMPASEDVRGMIERGFEVASPGPGEWAALDAEPPGNTSPSSLFFRGTESNLDQASMDEDADCPPDVFISRPPPPSAGVASQSSFASASPVEGGPSGEQGGPWVDLGWNDSTPPGLLSASSSEDENEDGAESWTGSADSHRSGLSQPSSPSYTVASGLDSELPSSMPTTLSSSSSPSHAPHPSGVRTSSPTASSEHPSTLVSASTSESLPPCRELIEQTDPLDVAGACFDPTGAYLYVATSDGLTEWTVQGATQRWWSSSGYI